MNNYFREINYAPLRTYNQAVMSFNIREDEGEEAAKEYLVGLTKDEKLMVLALLADVRRRGPDVVKREIIRSMPLQGEEEELA